MKHVRNCWSPTQELIGPESPVKAFLGTLVLFAIAFALLCLACGFGG